MSLALTQKLFIATIYGKWRQLSTFFHSMQLVVCVSKQREPLEFRVRPSVYHYNLETCLGRIQFKIELAHEVDLHSGILRYCIWCVWWSIKFLIRLWWISMPVYKNNTCLNTHCMRGLDLQGPRWCQQNRAQPSLGQWVGDLEHTLRVRFCFEGHLAVDVYCAYLIHFRPC